MSKSLLAVKKRIDIYPRVGQRSIIIGKTGTGKTYVILRLIRPFYGKHQIQILATKEDDKILSLPAPVVTSYQDLNDYPFPEYPMVIYYPNGFELSQPEVLDAWCEWVYMRKNTVAVVDELTKTVKGTYMPPGMLDMYTRGRSQNVTVFAGTQRPRGIPPTVYDEAEHFYKFYLTDIKDRKRVAEFTHPHMKNQVRDPHGFHYFSPYKGDEVYYINSID